MFQRWVQRHVHVRSQQYGVFDGVITNGSARVLRRDNNTELGSCTNSGDYVVAFIGVEYNL